jgi:hypothetical protein
MQSNNTHTIARQAEAQCLWALHRFGYLTAAQISALVYAKHGQGLVMARRTLRRIAERGLVLIQPGKLINDEQHYALSLNGAREVFQLAGVEARTGKDLLRIASPHRDACNWAAIHMMREGYPRVWTEREIQTGAAPVKYLGTKVPDVLAADQEGMVTWVEVEASRRGGRDMQHLVDWLLHTAFPPTREDTLISLNPPRDTYTLQDVRFVIAQPSAETFPARLHRAIASQGRIENPYTWAAERVQFQIGTALDAPVTPGFSQLG